MSWEEWQQGSSLCSVTAWGHFPPLNLQFSSSVSLPWLLPTTQSPLVPVQQPQRLSLKQEPWLWQAGDPEDPSHPQSPTQPMQVCPQVALGIPVRITLGVLSELGITAGLSSQTQCWAQTEGMSLLTGTHSPGSGLSTPKR